MYVLGLVACILYEGWKLGPDSEGSAAWVFLWPAALVWKIVGRLFR